MNSNIKTVLLFGLGLSLSTGLLSCATCDHEDGPVAPFKIGHILCTDGTVMSLCDYIKSEKEAIGIVFHVNSDYSASEQGYAVYIHESMPVQFADSCGVAQGTSASLTEEDGNENTYALYTTKGVGSPMATQVFDMWRYGQSAYIPSVAQLKLLRNELENVNRRIEAVGGDPIMTDYQNCWLWSSTEVEGQQADKAWLYSMNYGTIQETPKNQIHQIRPIITIRK